MSKSKGNVVTPENLVKEHSADAIRYWASRARLGVDTAFDASLFKIGAKLVTKLFNASKFVIAQFDRIDKEIGTFDTKDIVEPLDTALVDKLCKVIKEASENFENFEYAQALQTAEETFWHFCDHYLELVKVRSYSEEDTPGRRSALATLSWSIKTFLRLFAPFIPYITEEVWSWSFGKDGGATSVHKSAWPNISEVTAVKERADSLTYDAAIEVIGKIRAKKTENQKNLKWPVERLIIKGKESNLAGLKLCIKDVLSAGSVNTYELVPSSDGIPGDSLFAVEVTLGQN